MGVFILNIGRSLFLVKCLMSFLIHDLVIIFVDMDITVKLRVLLTIHQNGSMIIPKAFLGHNTGFAKLRKEGLIKITKSNNTLSASVTERGEAYIAQSLLDYK
jgi:hypothetical protein